MARILFFASAALLQVAAATAQSGELDATQPPARLEGLWTAENRYGPDIRGTLMILPRGSALVADFVGFTIAVEQHGNALSFRLPDGKGSFRGIRKGSIIEGQWVQRVTAGNGIIYATPVLLRADGRNRWRGEVVPLDEHMTYFLPLKRTGDGLYSTYLRNPERNQGIFIGATRLEQEGNSVGLVGTRRGQNKEQVIGDGRINPDSGVMSIPILWETFNFTRDTDASSPFYTRGNPPERYRYSPPVPLDDGWPVSTLEKEGID